MPDNPVSEQTRQYWLDTALSWAKVRLMPPQFDECKRALLQADPAEADSYLRARRDDLQKANLKLLATLQDLAAAREHAAISIARLAAAELLAAAAETAYAERDAARAEADGLAKLLTKCRLFVTYAQFSVGYQDENGRSQSYRSEDVRDEIDAALAAPAQPPHAQAAE